MAQIDSYLKRVNAECKLSFLEDIYDLYSFVPNEDLRALLAAFHTQLNYWFNVINSDLRYQFDDVGNKISLGGYFHADDSRQYLALIEQIDQLRSKLSNSDLAFKLTNDTYAVAIRQTRKFVAKSGGSTIPTEYAPVDIEELEPIFQFANGIAITQNQHSIYASATKIGAGSYATVYKYVDPNYDIPIVIKRADPSLNEKELARFKQEFDVLKQLHSPYVVEVYTYNSAENEYTMEYLDETISTYIGKYIGPNRKNLSLTKRKNIISQVCKGLEYIHSKNLLHRDISLTNVFIKHYDGIDVVKIGDFGLVKLPNSELTSQASEFKGSLNDSDLIHVGFANYEMCHEIFALTRLCTYILTGQATPHSICDGAIKQFWEKGTSPNRAERYKNVSELYNAIRQLTQEDLEYLERSTERI